uniref:Uncharacterized protein n=1 Tax=Ilumatobacter coccineus TaxID=467094 RepID=A0A2G6KCB0_9ACTN|nr:MAG: hypothetical protein CSA55_02060 [Ilumatobacter coccineus]
MGSKVVTPRGRNLYEFWGEMITDRIAEDLAASPGAKVVVNLASKEYFTAVHPDRLEATVVTPVFLDAKGDGDYKVVSFYAKRARGAMAGWIVRNRITAMSRLVDFDDLGYAYDPDRSTKLAPVFRRRNEP